MKPRGAAVARRAHNPEVASSILAAATILAAVVLSACASITPPAVASQPDRCPSLEAGDVVRILTDFGFVMAPVAPVQTPAGVLHRFGTTDFTNRRVFVNAGYIAPIRRLALIHELLHVRRRELKLQEDEVLVRECAIGTYRRIYGGDLDLPELMRDGR